MQPLSQTKSNKENQNSLYKYKTYLYDSKIVVFIDDEKSTRLAYTCLMC